MPRPHFPTLPTRAALALAGSLACMPLTMTPAHAQSAVATVPDVVIPPGATFDKAIFRLWIPPKLARVQAVLVLTPGSNGDGREAVSDTVWQQFATQHQLALVASQLTDKPHEQSFIESYVDVSKGTGQALLDALTQFASTSGHRELASAPLLLWGMSAGGQFNYEFAAWKPERVMAFVVNKGGIYYSALVPLAARRVPALLFIGGKDLAFRTNTIVGLFAVNRRGGALWALANEPSAAHIVGGSREVAMAFYADVLALRGPELKPLDERAGFIGDLTTLTVTKMGDSKAPTVPTAWLPSERVAFLWQRLAMDSLHK